MTKRVLITGGAGFIAHHLIGQILKTTDWEIISLDRLDYSGNLNRLHDIMISIHNQCQEYGSDKSKTNYVKGANIAGFIKVADAMLDQGVV